jgi:hypothetical protein
VARFPCSVENHYNRGRNHYVYVAWGTGDNFTKARLRLCPIHFATFQDNLAQFKCPSYDNAVGTDWGPNTDCVTCLQPVDERGWQVFITSYPPNNEREDYWGKLHIDCIPPAAFQTST